MSEMTRPKGVPAEAFYDREEKLWQVGDYNPKFKKKKVPTGLWKYYREDGSLSCISNFNEEGEQDGTVETYHPDGTLASRGEWKNGCRQGHFIFVRSEGESQEYYPAGDNTWRYEFDSPNNWTEENERWFLKDGRPCTSRGVVLDEAFELDRTLAKGNPDNFLENVSEENSSNESLGIEKFWGKASPEIFKFFNYCRSNSDDLNYSGFSPGTACRTFSTNIWQSLIDYPWNNINEELAAVFLGAIRLGSIGDSDAAYYTLFEEKNAVYYWSHDTYYFDEVIAPDLSVFAYQIAISAAFNNEVMSEEGAAEAWQKLDGRVSVPWEISGGLDDDLQKSGNFSGSLEEFEHIRSNFLRVHWILELLRSDDERRMKEVKEAFRQDLNPALSEEEFAQELERGKTSPVCAIYLLWRSFFFNQDERLTQARAAFEKHSAPVVQDLVLFLSQTKEPPALKNIKDLYAVRAEFLKLDLLPERRVERQKEEQERQRLRQEKLSKLETQAQTIVRTSGNAEEELLQLAYDSIANSAELSIIESAIKEYIQAGNFSRERRARVIAIFRTLEEAKGAASYNRDTREEVKASGRWLGRELATTGDTALLLPFLLAEAYGKSSWICGYALKELAGELPAGSLNRKLVEKLLAFLHLSRGQDEFAIKKTIAAMVLGANKIQSAVRPMLTVVEEFLAEVRGILPTDSRLNTSYYDDLLLEVTRALLSIAEDQAVFSAFSKKEKGECIDSLYRLFDFAKSALMSKLAALSLKAAAVWGGRDITQRISGLLSMNDDEARETALLITEEFAKELPKKKLKEFVNFSFRNPNDNDNAVTLLFYRAGIAIRKALPDVLKDKLDIVEGINHAGELCNYGAEAWFRYRLCLIETAILYPEVPLAVIDDFRSLPDLQIQKALCRLYESRGQAYPQVEEIAWPDIFLLVAEQGSDAVEKVAALVVPKDTGGIVLRIPAFKFLGESPSAAGAVALCKALEEMLDRYREPQAGEDPSNELYCLIRAVKAHSKQFADIVQTAEARCLSFRDDRVASIYNGGKG